MSPHRHGHQLPDLEGRVKATLGRAWWRELSSRKQVQVLRRSAVWAGEGLPSGDGRRIVLVPGYMANDTSMVLVADWLRRGGYEVSYAPVGRNAWASTTAVDAVVGELQRSGDSVTVIGHSRGGQQARVAVARFGAVDRLVTLGSPVRHHRPHFLPIRVGVGAARLAGRMGFGREVPDGAEEAFERDLVDRDLPASVRWTAIWTKRDGIVQWKACVAADATENVEVDCTHLGLTGSVPAFEAIARALA